MKNTIETPLHPAPAAEAPTVPPVCRPQISKYNMGWLQLTISTGDSTRQLTNALKEQGWMKMQPRLWMRPCVGVGSEAMHIEPLKEFVPYAANIRFMFVTDKQWADSVTLIGQNYPVR